MSIRIRLTVWYSVILGVTLIIFGSAIYGVIYFNTYNEVEKRIYQQMLHIDPAINIDIDTGAFDFTIKTRNSFQENQIGAQIHDYSKGVNIPDQNLKRMGVEIPIPSGEPEQMVKSMRSVQIQGHPFLVYQQPISAYQGGPTIALLQVAAYTGPEQNLFNSLKKVLVMGSVIMIIIASSFGLFLAHKAIRPIGKVIEAANQIQKGADLSLRIEYQGPQDEIGRLIGTVNDMLSRMNGSYKELEDAYAAQKRFVSDASHELRTPLTTIRGNVDLLQKIWSKEDGDRPNIDEETLQLMSAEALSDIADEAKRMSQLVSDMLSLARADTGQTFEKSPVPLEPLVQEVTRRANFLPHKAEWIVGNLSTLNGVYVLGNKDYLQQMLFIFIENAFKYTPEGQVSVDAFRYQDQIGLRIADTGIGMNKEDVPLIFDRFYRADQSRGVTEGIGLGLSIAKWIIEEMNGSVEVVTRHNEGSTFIIWLPMIFPVPLE
jgi:two-component system OmpR family sensor kinase